MVDEQQGGSWVEASVAVEAELTAWRAAHPRATLTQIELAVEAATARMRAHWIGLLTQQTEQAEEVAEPAAPPTCPSCGGPLRRRGRRKRRILVAHQAQPLELEREYFWCPACGVGISPPR